MSFKKILYFYIAFLIFFFSNLSFASIGQVKLKLKQSEIRRSNEDDFKKLNVGDKIKPGDTIRTSTNSYVEIHFEIGGFLRLLPDTTVGIISLTRSEINIRLFGGNIISKFSQNNSDEFYQITTSSSVIRFKKAAVKVYHINDKTTVICVKGSSLVSSNIPEWQQIQPKRIGTTDKIVLTNLINQTNAPILTASEEELFIDEEIFAQRQTAVPEEEVRLQDFRREAEQARVVKKKKADTGFRFNAAFGAVQLQRTGYFLTAGRPEFFYNDLSIALYLPIYYDGINMPWVTSEWGNKSEWDFDSTQDALGDLLLKIDHLEFGKKNTAYYFYIGKLERFTIGNGFIVRNLNNTESYPLIRRVGLYVETDFGFIGAQGFINDINVADIQGYRIFFRPAYKSTKAIKKLEIGIIGTFDTSAGYNVRKNPSLFTLGADLKLPIISSKKMELAILTDYIVQGYRFKDSAVEATFTLPDSNSSSGLKFLEGWAWHISAEILLRKILLAQAGFILGYKGIVPGWMDAFYMVSRKQKAQRILDPTRQTSKYGFHADIKFFIKNIFIINLRYMLLVGDASTGYIYDDKVHFSVELVKGALWKFHMKFAYDRINLYGNIFSNFFKNALLTIELGLLWNKNVSFIGTLRRFFDNDGIEYRTFLLETRLTF